MVYLGYIALAILGLLLNLSVGYMLWYPIYFYNVNYGDGNLKVCSDEDILGYSLVCLFWEITMPATGIFLVGVWLYDKFGRWFDWFCKNVLFRRAQKRKEHTEFCDEISKEEYSLRQ